MGKKPPTENQNAVDGERIKGRSIIIVAMITAVSGVMGSVINGIFASRKIEGLTQQLTSSATKASALEQDVQESKPEQDALYRLTAAYLESDFQATSGKSSPGIPAGMSETEFDYRRLRRAVFLNLGVLRANSTILGKTLAVVAQQGFGWVAPQKGRILGELGDIKAARLRWLEDSAIPQLQSAVDQASRSTAQTTPTAQVPFPASIRIFDDNPGAISVTNIEALKEEATLLKQSITP